MHQTHGEHDFCHKFWSASGRDRDSASEKNSAEVTGRGNIRWQRQASAVVLFQPFLRRTLYSYPRQQQSVPTINTEVDDEVIKKSVDDEKPIYTWRSTIFARYHAENTGIFMEKVSFLRTYVTEMVAWYILLNITKVLIALGYNTGIRLLHKNVSPYLMRYRTWNLCKVQISKNMVLIPDCMKMLLEMALVLWVKKEGFPLRHGWDQQPLAWHNNMRRVYIWRILTVRWRTLGCMRCLKVGKGLSSITFKKWKPKAVSVVAWIGFCSFQNYRTGASEQSCGRAERTGNGLWEQNYLGKSSFSLMKRKKVVWLEGPFMFCDSHLINITVSRTRGVLPMTLLQPNKQQRL